MWWRLRRWITTFEFGFDRCARPPRVDAIWKILCREPSRILKKAIKPIIDEYEYVIIDCPPNLRNHHFERPSHRARLHHPHYSDVLSTYGIPQIVKRVKDFAGEIGETVEPLGIVISKYRAQLRLHSNTMRRLRTNGDAPVFNTIVPESGQIAEAAEFTKLSTLRQKYGYQGQFDSYRALTEEIMKAAA